VPSKVRVYELAKALGRDNKTIIAVLKNEFGVSVKSHSSSIEQTVANQVTAFVKQGIKLSEADAKVAKPPTKKASEGSSTPAPAAAPVMRLIKKKDRKKTVADEEPEKKTGLDALRAETEEASKEFIRKVRGEEPAAKADEAQPEVAEATAETATEAPVETPPVQEPDDDKAKDGAAEDTETPEKESLSVDQGPSLEPITPSRGRISAALPDMPGIKVIKPGERRLVEPTVLGKAPVKLAQAPRRPKSDKKAGDKPQSSEQQQAGGDNFSRGGERSTKFNTIPPHLRDRSKKAEVEDNVDKLLHAPKRKKKQEIELPVVTEVRLDEQLTVRELAEKLGKTDTDIIRHVFMKGMMVTVNQTLEVSFARTIAEELEIKVLETEVKEDTYDATEAMSGDDLDDKKYKNLEAKAPVVSIMGHVDHGKTSLLDAIRESRQQITKGEAGGITQSIGAYNVIRNDQRIVFLDTPGHEAFTAMRMRGAQATNIAILVVAADDGVMPQTIEAINHAKAANIPIIVAINKMDKENADPYRVMAELMEHGINVEEMGGDTLAVKVSAMDKTGLDELLDQIVLVSELLNLQGDPTVAAEGVVIEAKLDKRRGPLMTALIQNGTLNVGDNVLIGSVGGRVRALIDDNRKQLKTAGPSTPVEILGMSDVPNAGDKLIAYTDDKAFKRDLAEAKDNDRQTYIERRQIMPGLQAPDGGEAERASFLHFIVKADSQGATEAVNESLQALSTDEVMIKIIHSGTGNISEADIMLASASEATIIGFNVGNESGVDNAAERNDVTIRNYDVIYHINEDVEKMMVGELSPDIIEVELGRAEVRDLFTISNRVIAGCMVTDGKVTRAGTVTVMRGGEELHRGRLSNLKRFKDDVKEVAQGFECGIQIDGFNTIEVGDELVFTHKEEKARTLESLKRGKDNKASKKVNKPAADDDADADETADEASAEPAEV
jgi:translation initiation factor IF-2